jgi:spore germination cell wall hydrolase CwlJ-like protein
MSQGTKWRLAPLAAVAATVLTIGAGTGPAHARDDTPAAVEAAAMTLPRPRPSSAREVPAPLDVRVTAAPVEAEVYQRRQVNCLAKAIYFEARSESVDGQFAVARVILNRTESGHYPETICGVVYQNANRINRCQFSFACDKLPDQPDESIAWALALGMAEALVRTEHPLLSQKLLRSTHYHADYVRPYWAPQLAMTGSIGRHIFYIEER